MAGSVSEFCEWVKSNGGDDAFLEILKKFGFSSKLSLGESGVLYLGCYVFCIHCSSNATLINFKHH